MALSEPDPDPSQPATTQPLAVSAANHAQLEEALAVPVASLQPTEMMHTSKPIASSRRAHMRSARTGGGLSLTLAMLVATGLTPTSTAAQEPASGHDQAQMHLYPLSELKWGSGPASLPSGAQFVVLEGDPAKEGLFTLRLRLPDGYQVPPHYHSGVEHVTVIAGTFNVGVGEKFDRAATKPMPAGTFGYWPPPMRHFAWAQGETILQLHGVGPWTITYVNPADDPRKR